MKRCAIILVLSLLQTSPALANFEPPDSLLSIWSPEKMAPANPDTVHVRFIYISFPGNPDSLLNERRLVEVPSEFASILSHQSRNAHTVIWQVISDPIVSGRQWIASHSADDYHNALITDYQYYRGEPTFGELNAETVFKIKAAYDAASLPNPFTGSDCLVFIYTEDPFENRGWAGISSACLMQYRIPFLTNANGISCEHVFGNYATLKFVIQHEYGHNILGLAHSPADNGGIPLGFYPYGNYSVMRQTVRYNEGYVPFHTYDLTHTLGWYSPVIDVTSNLRDMVITDARLGGPVLQVHIAPVSEEVSEGDWTEREQYFLVSLHSGVNEDIGNSGDGLPVYRSSGLAIWHVVKKPYLDIYLSADCIWDLEAAGGRYIPPAFEVQSAESGVDSLDNWQGRDGNEFGQYPGSRRDFFSLAESPEFSFRSNPSSHGYSTMLATLQNHPNYGLHVTTRVCPQTQANSVMIRIKEDYGDSMLVDVLLAPYEDILSPSGGEVLLAGKQRTINWSTNITTDTPGGIISIVDLCLSLDGGQQWIPIASGVDATLGQYTWTPSESQVSDNCLIKAVFHNINTTHVGEDVSDAPFSIVPAPTMQYANKSTETLVDYPGTPYSEVPLDYDNDGKKDLMITIKDSPGRLYGQNYLNSNQVPQFSDRTGYAFVEGHLPVAAMRGIAVADIDNDQDRDMFIAAETQARLYSNSGSPDYKFSNVTQAAGLVPYSYESWAGSWGDYDGDGRVDLAICGVTGSGTDPQPDMQVGGWTTLMRNASWNGSIAFSDVTASAFDIPPATACVSAAWGDLNYDGRLDLVVTDERNLQILGGNQPALAMYFNDGDGTFTSQHLNAQIMWQAGFVHDTAAVSLVDFDNDGHLDMALAQNPSWGDAWVHFNDGAGGWKDRPAVRFDIDKTIDVRYMDQDLDGRQDVLLLPMATDAPVHLMLNRSLTTPDTAVFFDVASEVQLVDGGLRADGAAISDFNFDGDPDLFLGRQTVTNKFFYKNVRMTGQEASSNNWVGVRLVGTGVSNEACLGAQVKVQVGDFQQVQVVDGGSGRGGQADNVLVWGLGSRTGLITAATVWPNGETQLDTLSVNAINAVADRTPVKLLGATVTGSYVAKPGAKADWIFEWETEYAGRSALEKVTIWDATNPPQCETLGTIELTVGGPGVVSTIAPTATGRYFHRLTWENVNCVPPCNYNYKVSSATDIKRSTSAQKQIKVKVCLQ